LIEFRGRQTWFPGELLCYFHAFVAAGKRFYSDSKIPTHKPVSGLYPFSLIKI